MNNEKDLKEKYPCKNCESYSPYVFSICATTGVEVDEKTGVCEMYKPRKANYE